MNSWQEHVFFPRFAPISNREEAPVLPVGGGRLQESRASLIIVSLVHVLQKMGRCQTFSSGCLRRFVFSSPFKEPAGLSLQKTRDSGAVEKSLLPGFPIWPPLEYAPSDNSLMLAKGRVEFKLARRFSRSRLRCLEVAVLQEVALVVERHFPARR